MESAGVRHLSEQIERVGDGNGAGVILVVDDLKSISNEALRLLAFSKQRFGQNFDRGGGREGRRPRSVRVQRPG